MMKRARYLLMVLATLLAVGRVQAESAIFAGGCFWCMESDFEKVEGVTEVVSGFTGGTAKDPIYFGDHTGHYEAVLVTYDPNKVTYQELLDYYWVNIDPFDAKGQFCDKGPSYRSAVFVADEEQKRLAEQSRERVVEAFPDMEVVTPILPAATFYPIKGKESYHQDYYKKSPIKYNIYRTICGRDRRLEEIWGERATVGH